MAQYTSTAFKLSVMSLAIAAMPLMITHQVGNPQGSLIAFVSTLVSKQTETIVEVVDEPELKAAAIATPVELRQTMRVRLYEDPEKAKARYASLSNAAYYAEAQQPAPSRQASLPPTAVTTNAEPKKEQHAWNATLPERQEIAKNYLEHNCPAILALEKMQSQASVQETNARFMRAQSPGAIIATVKGQLRGHPIVVGQFCPTEFYNQLFAKR